MKHLVLLNIFGGENWRVIMNIEFDFFTSRRWTFTNRGKKNDLAWPFNSYQKIFANFTWQVYWARLNAQKHSMQHGSQGKQLQGIKKQMNKVTFRSALLLMVFDSNYGTIHSKKKRSNNSGIFFELQSSCTGSRNDYKNYWELHPFACCYFTSW